MSGNIFYRIKLHDLGNFLLLIMMLPTIKDDTHCPRFANKQAFHTSITFDSDFFGPMPLL